MSNRLNRERQYKYISLLIFRARPRAEVHRMYAYSYFGSYFRSLLRKILIYT